MKWQYFTTKRGQPYRVSQDGRTSQCWDTAKLRWIQAGFNPVVYNADAWFAVCSWWVIVRAIVRSWRRAVWAWVTGEQVRR